MAEWRFWRMFVVTLLIVSPMTALSGCGSARTGPGTVLSPQEDTTLDPKTDSTMSPNKKKK